VSALYARLLFQLIPKSEINVKLIVQRSRAVNLLVVVVAVGVGVGVAGSVVVSIACL